MATKHCCLLGTPSATIKLNASKAYFLLWALTFVAQNFSCLLKKSMFKLLGSGFSFGRLSIVQKLWECRKNEVFSFSFEFLLTLRDFYCLPLWDRQSGEPTVALFSWGDQFAFHCLSSMEQQCNVNESKEAQKLIWKSKKTAIIHFFRFLCCPHIGHASRCERRPLALGMEHMPALQSLALLRDV